MGLSIKRYIVVNLYFQQKRKNAISPPLFRLFQIFLFQKLGITLQPLFRAKNPNIKKIAGLMVYGNLNEVVEGLCPCSLFIGSLKDEPVLVLLQLSS